MFIGMHHTDSKNSVGVKCSFPIIKAYFLEKGTCHSYGVQEF